MVGSILECFPGPHNIQKHNLLEKQVAIQIVQSSSFKLFQGSSQQIMNK